jgi:hypothetical protein
MLLRLRQFLLFGLSVGCFAYPCQAQSRDQEFAQVLRRWNQFDQPEQAQMLASIQRSILSQEDPILAVISRLEPLLAKAKLAEIKSDKARYYDSKKFAPALKLRTKILSSSSATWRRLAKKYPSNHLEIEPTEWRWSLGRKALIRPRKELRSEQNLQMLWNGKLPKSSLISCQIEALLHTDASQSEIADYFEHSYRDRNGKVYADISLARMWGSGLTFGISDVESIAYLQLILDEHQIKSPIAKGLHEGIYALIRDSFAELRDYQQLRQGLAARFADPNGQVPMILTSIADRFDLAWVYLEYDISRMREFLIRNPNRKEFLTALAAMEKEPPIEPSMVQKILADRAAFPARLAAFTRIALRQEGLLSLRGR